MKRCVCVGGGEKNKRDLNYKMRERGREKAEAEKEDHLSSKRLKCSKFCCMENKMSKS